MFISPRMFLTAVMTAMTRVICSSAARSTRPSSKAGKDASMMLGRQQAVLINLLGHEGMMGWSKTRICSRTLTAMVWAVCLAAASSP